MTIKKRTDSKRNRGRTPGRGTAVSSVICRVFGGVAFGGTLLRVLQDELQLIEIEFLRTGP